MPTLLEITEGFQAIDDKLADNGGDISDPQFAALIDAWLADLQTELEAKCDGYATYIRELELRAACRREESERLARAAQSQERAAEYLSKRLKESLEKIGVKKVTGRLHEVAIVANGGKINIAEGANIPECFMSQPKPPPPKPDLETIRSALEAGEVLPFAEYAPRGSRLVIR